MITNEHLDELETWARSARGIGTNGGTIPVAICELLELTGTVRELQTRVAELDAEVFDLRAAVAEFEHDPDLTRAVADEREACAEVFADDPNSEWFGGEVAQAIRARGESK
jgi:hypothetical protein